MMETYQLKSKLVESDREFLIRTCNDTSERAILSEVWINGRLAETETYPHLEDCDPDDIVSLLKRTHQQKKDEIEGLMEAFRQALQDGRTDNLCELGIAFYYRKYYLEARELFQKATAGDAGNHRAFNYLGLTELALGETSDAAKMLHEAARQQPAYADYRNNLGLALHAHGACEQAVGEFEQALGLNLYYADAYFNLGMVLLTQALDQTDTSTLPGIIGKATDAFKKAVLIYPDYDTTLFEEATRSISGSDLRKTYELFARIRQRKQEEHRLEFADFHKKHSLDPLLATEGGLQRHIRYLERQVQKNPTYVDLWADLSRSYLEYARVLWEKGVTSLTKTSELNPSITRVALCREEAEEEMVSMTATLQRMAKKG